MSVVIRQMVKEDIDQVQNVAKESWHATYKGIIPQNIQDNFLKNAYRDSMMEKRLSESILFVAEIEGNIVGFANFTPVTKEGQSELSALYLYPEYQGQGIGTALLQQGMKELKQLNEIYIDVEKENTIGTTFYEAKGFKIMAEYDDNFDGHLLKTIRMCLKV